MGGRHTVDPAEELNRAALGIRAAKLGDGSSDQRGPDAADVGPGVGLNKLGDAEASTAIDELPFYYGDWSINLHNLAFGERLGRGSSGEIYRGRYLGRDVAIKVMSLEVNDDDEDFRDHSAEQLLRMFAREVSVMTLLRHRNVLQLIGACPCWPKLYIVTELMLSDVLQSTLLRRPGAEGHGGHLRGSLEILRDAAKGVEFLHSKGIVHRDLKAANLLIDGQGVVKVCDFGLSRPVKPVGKRQCATAGRTEHGAAPGDLKVFQRNLASHNLPGVKIKNLAARGLSKVRSRLRRGAVSPAAEIASNCPSWLPPSTSDRSWDMTGATGTLKWMAPEVLLSKPYDCKADVYSFGILIWEVVTREVPYAGLGLTPSQSANAVAHRGLRPTLPSSVPSKLARLAQQCWHEDPRQRPELSAILAVLEDLLLEAAPTAPHTLH